MSRLLRLALALSLVALIVAAALGVAPIRLVPEEWGEVGSREEAGAQDLHVGFLGVSSLIFDDGRTQVLIDGFVSRPPLHRVVLGSVSSDEVQVMRAIERWKMDRLAAILVSHTHYDHALDSSAIAIRTGARLMGTASAMQVAQGAGLGPESRREIRPGDELQMGDFHIRILPGRHSPALAGINDDLGSEIEAPLKLPARASEFREGGSLDFLIEHRGRRILVKPGANWVPGALAGVQADGLFLSVGALGRQDEDFRRQYFAETLGRVRPRLVVPLHWDDFFQPVGGVWWAMGPWFDSAPLALRELSEAARRDGVAFGVLGPGNSLAWGNAFQ